jgi:hypothetical protein
MHTMYVTAAMSTPSLVLRYAAAFFFVLVAIFLAYALFKAGKALERLDKVLADVDENGIPLMNKAGTTLDGVNANLGNVDEITKDVAGITDKLDKMAGSMETAVTTPARKAAAFSAGVQSAVSSFMKRDKPGDAASGAASAADGWSFADTPAQAADAEGASPSSGETFSDAAAEAADTAASAAADVATAAGETVADAAAAAGESVVDAASDVKPDGA